MVSLCRNTLATDTAVLEIVGTCSIMKESETGKFHVPDRWADAQESDDTQG